MRWLLLPVAIALHTARAEQSIVEGPQETFATIGKTIVLRCKVHDQKGAVQWMKNGFGLGVDRGLRFFPRYSMVGSVSKGEYNLQIVNVSVADDDVYACQVSEAANEPSVISNPAKLTVLMRPSVPQITTSSHVLTAIAGETVAQSCISKKGKPPPRIGWALASDNEGRNIVTWLGESRAKFGHLYKGGVVAQESVPADIQEHLEREAHVFSIISNISFMPRPEDDRRFLVCLSQHETFPEKAEVSTVKLSLQYAPKVNLTIASPHKLREGGSALLACNVDAKPLDNVRISWIRNGNEPLRQTTDTFTFESLKMEDHRSEYTCQATNVIGSSSATIRLDVTFGPRIMSSVQDREVNEGEHTSFRCEAIGNPAPNVFWTKAGDEQIIAKGDLLSLENVRTWQQGEYVCTATVEGFKPAQSSHFLHIRGPPVVTVMDDVTGDVGDTVELSCRISGRPKPPEVKWTRDGNELNYSSGRIQVHQIARSYGLESKLTIRDVRDTDFGIYNCSANNGLGSDRKGVAVRSRGIMDLLSGIDLMTLLAVACGLLVLLHCICCCLCFRKRRSSHKKGTKFIDDQSDVTVKCEALDGQYYPEMYSSPLDNGNIVQTKDYISIPQNNPDLDYLGPPTTFAPSLYPKYLNSSSVAEYSGMTPRYEPSYGSFASGVSTPGGMSDVYGISYSDKAPVLETLPEVDTPKASNYNFLSTPEQIRPLSRTSTHV